MSGRLESGRNFRCRGDEGGEFWNWLKFSSAAPILPLWLPSPPLVVMSVDSPSAAPPHLLYVDDEHLLHNVLDRLFTRRGVRVTTCTSAREAVDLLRRTAFDLVLTDFKMPDMDGLELLAHVRETYPDVPVIMLTAHASVQHAVGVMRDGAVDYIPKPFSTAALVERIERHLNTRRLGAAAAEGVASGTASGSASGGGHAAKAGGGALSEGERLLGRGGAFIGEHPSVEQLRALIPRIARSEAAVFVHGESGTGKEVVSRWIHRESLRADGPFVAINCANLPTELVESHLFGHRKGAFTGAVEDMTGAFERAAGGTLLLDEITEIDLAVQAKLLRVLQEQEFQKLGASTPQRANVRVVATSNRDLHEAIREGVFREDLYHRLAVFPLYVPPLRERPSDVPLLARHFCDKYVAFYRLPPKRLAPALVERLVAYAWPGNVRQLENTLHRGVVLAGDADVIDVADVMNAFIGDDRADRPEGARVNSPLSGTTSNVHSIQDAPSRQRRRTLDEIEREAILDALADASHNQEAAARQLGISSRTIRNKLRRYRELDDAA